MHKKITFLLVFLLAGILGLRAQCTSSPALLQEDSKNVVVYYHADQGNLGLLNQPSTAEIYAHTGVITNQSSSLGDWMNAPTWGDNSPKYKLEYVSPNLWKLNIGNIREYYGITDSSVVIKKLAFVFRTGDKVSEGKGEGNTDIFLDVYPDGLQVALNSSTNGKTVVEAGTKVTFTVECTNDADLSLAVNGATVGTATGASSMTADYTFASTGNFEVVATAVYNGETVTATERYTVPVPSSAADYPGGTPKMGAIRNADGSITFCIAAPQKTSAILVGSWDGYEVSTANTMSYQDYEGVRYFWITVEGLERGVDLCYYYLIDGNLSVGDPYARLILDPYHDKSIPADVYPNLPAYPYDKISTVPLAVFNDNLNDYDWRVTNFTRPEAQNLIIYELLVRDFTGTEGQAKGNGTIRQALGKLNYLQDLGVNAIELLPINEFNGNNSWGYNPNFYFAPDKAYGTPDDYKLFIDECHSRGIAVILDMVFNQSDWLHPWYAMYDRNNNPFYNADAPHAYSVLNDWNQGYPLVEQQFHDVLRYWLTEYKVDGFRFDLVKGLGNNNSYSNNGDAATNSYNQSRIDRMKRFQETIQSVSPGAYCINENLAGSQEENEMAKSGEIMWANVNTQGIQYAIGTNSNAALDRFYAPNDGGRTWGSTVSYLESHDEQRLAYRQNTAGVAGVKGNLANSMRRLGSAAAQMILSPGAHMIWQFSELGNYENAKNDMGGNNVDPKTVRWSLFDNANRRGLYDCYSELIRLRRSQPELFAQNTSMYMRFGSSDWTNGRSLTLKNDGRELYCLINPNVDNDITMTMAFNSTNNADYTIYSKSYNTEPTFDAGRSTVTIPANSYVVIVNQKVISGVDGVEVDDYFVPFAERGAIVVPGTATADIFRLDGTVVGTGVSGRVDVASGIYVVRCGERAHKLVVR